MNYELNLISQGPGKIRAIAICVICRGDDIFVFEGRDEQKDETFYRPLGGAIEFGEYSAQAVQREFREEIGSEIEQLRFWHTLENMFILEGIPGHKIVFVYRGRLAGKSIYEQPFILGTEDNGQSFKAMWKATADFEGGPPLYPDGLLELLTTRAANL